MTPTNLTPPPVRSLPVSSAVREIVVRIVQLAPARELARTSGTKPPPWEQWL